jgi:hypothetical protein
MPWVAQRPSGSSTATRVTLLRSYISAVWSKYGDWFSGVEKRNRG